MREVESEQTVQKSVNCRGVLSATCSRAAYKFFTAAWCMAHPQDVTEKPSMAAQGVLSLGNLDAARDWGHARDYAKCMWLMLQQPQPADFVIGTGISSTVRCVITMELPKHGMHRESTSRRDAGGPV